MELRERVFHKALMPKTLTLSQERCEYLQAGVFEGHTGYMPIDSLSIRIKVLPNVVSVDHYRLTC